MDDLHYIADLENLEIAEEPVQRHNRYENLNPFDILSDHQFVQSFRLSKELVIFLINELTPLMKPQQRVTDLSIRTRVLVALRFFASGSYQLDVGRGLFVTVSQSSVSRCIEEVSNALNEPVIFNRWIHFHRNFEEFNIARLRFYEHFNFPGVVGCVDCTHVAIFTPKIDDPEMPEYAYINRKGYHSINVQLICDSKLKIINILARYPGSTHDAFIWENSNVLELFRNLHAQGFTNYYLLGDSGYPLRTWLLTPIEGDPAGNTPEFYYNEAHKRTRSIIERCNGVLKMRFRCLLKDRTLHYKPPTACKIINACAVLHNMCIEHNIPLPENEEQVDRIDLGVILNNQNHNDQPNDHNPLRRVNPELVAGRRTRAQLVNNVFQHIN